MTLNFPGGGVGKWWGLGVEWGLGVGWVGGGVRQLVSVFFICRCGVQALVFRFLYTHPAGFI